MYLFYGVLCIAVAFLTHSFTLLATRKPVQPFWVHDGMLLYVLIPSIVGMLSAGFVLCLLAIKQAAPTTIEIISCLLVAAATAIFYLAFGFKRKIATLEAQGASAAVLPLANGGSRLQSEPEPPQFRKAA